MPTKSLNLNCLCVPRRNITNRSEKLHIRTITGRYQVNRGQLEKASDAPKTGVEI